jgi:hypothetical protein
VALDVPAQEVEAVVYVDGSGLVLGEAQPDGGSCACDFVAERFSVLPGAEHHHCEVVGVPGEPVGRASFAAVAAPVPFLGKASSLCVEVLVDHAQGDVREQRGQDSALRCARHGVPEGAFPCQDSCVQEGLDQPEDPPVADASAHSVHEDRVVDLRFPRCARVADYLVRAG